MLFNIWIDTLNNAMDKHVTDCLVAEAETIEEAEEKYLKYKDETKMLSEIIFIEPLVPDIE